MCKECITLGVLLVIFALLRLALTLVTHHQSLIGLVALSAVLAPVLIAVLMLRR